jgi:hypothetical protein
MRARLKAIRKKKATERLREVRRVTPAIGPTLRVVSAHRTKGL